MKKVFGLMCIIFLGILGYSEAAGYVDSNCQSYAAGPGGFYNVHVVNCISHGDYADIRLRGDSNDEYIVTHYPSQFPELPHSSIFRADISWCTGTAFGKTGAQEYGIVTKKSCCPVGNIVNDNDECVVDCTAGTYYGKKLDKCCRNNSGYIAYNWKKKNNSSGYFADCGEGVLYKKGVGGSVISDQSLVPSDSGANAYSLCEKGKLVTSDGRCVPCVGAASLSGVTVDSTSAGNCHIACAENEVAYTGASGAPGCCPGTVKDGVCHQELLKMGVRVNNACLIDGQCGLNIYRILGIRASDNYDPSVSNVASDVINAAISMLGTIVTIVFVVAGVICSMNSISGKDSKNAMKVFVDSAVGMLMVWGSYAIIRLIQFIATAGS